MNYPYLTSASLSDMGRVRKNNEDAEVILPDVGVFCVADGMGGGDAGEIASGKVVEAVKHFGDALKEARGADMLKYKSKYLARTLKQVGLDIRTYADDHDLSTCGTTAVVLSFDYNQPRQAGVLNVGDSRLYRLREGELEQLTVDHSAENESEMARRGQYHPSMKNVITRAIGVHMDLSVEETWLDVQPEDLFLICSDGLNGMISDDMIALVLNRPRQELDKACALLVEAANRAGGKDNITVALIRVLPHACFDAEPAPLVPFGDEGDEGDEDEVTVGELRFRQMMKEGTEETMQTAAAHAFLPAGSGGGGPAVKGGAGRELPRPGLWRTVAENPGAYVVVPLVIIALAVLLFFWAQNEYAQPKDKDAPAEQGWGEKEVEPKDADRNGFGPATDPGVAGPPAEPE